MKNLKLSVPEIKIISHSLGVSLYHNILSKKKKERVLPVEFYRNYYSHKGKDLLWSMENKGLLTKREVFGGNVFHATDKAIEIFKKDYLILVPYLPIKSQGIDYLKKKINSYCWINQYNFCEDNSNHVIQYYKEYFKEGHYVSSTTNDCILTFQKELKKWS